MRGVDLKQLPKKARTAIRLNIVGMQGKPCIKQKLVGGHLPQ